MTMNILVSLNDREQRQPLSAFAAQLAARHQGRLMGLYVMPALKLYPVITMHVPADVFEAQKKTFRRQAQEAETVFREACKTAQVPCEWRQVESFSPLIADAVIEAARSFDLVIAAQPPGSDGADLEADFADRLILESGRPVLLLPRAGSWPQEEDAPALVAYNASREAARAVHDAIALLKGRRLVEVAWIDAPADSEPQALSDLVAALRHHGISAKPRLLSSAGEDAGAVLLSHARDIGAQLLVMGAWGHTRLREYILGGATRTVLEEMSLPVLFSH